jgi:hypothetical protein
MAHASCNRHEGSASADLSSSSSRLPIVIRTYLKIDVSFEILHPRHSGERRKRFTTATEGYPVFPENFRKRWIPAFAGMTSTHVVFQF